MTMEENLKKLENELKYLTKEAKEEEIEKNKHLLESKDINIKEISRNIYINRGLDISKIQSDTNWAPIITIDEMILSLYKMKMLELCQPAHFYAGLKLFLWFHA